MTKNKRYIFALLFLVLLIGWIMFLRFLPPEAIVAAIGIHNGYFVAGITAFLGGLSVFTSVPYALVVITLAAGGLNPFILGLSAGVGLVAGDVTSYFIGYHGRRVFSQRVQEALNYFHAWLLRRRRQWMVPLFIFLYGALIPLSNDIVVISFGFARYPFWMIMIPLGIGSIMFNTWVAFAGAYGVDFLMRVFVP